MKIKHDKTPYFSVTDSKPFYVLGKWRVWREIRGSSLWQRIKGEIYNLIKNK